ncbi:Y-family DNA polymerase [Sphingomonas nostoxanthinifaciens]|uniref:Y-family DNA polymerase n=1 Tax=Sphingomonas nostoxanthinifaciens TaxID=2872652 RepID=UPI001CC1FFED|nr:DNA polymerase Y family protein [Sphingomonas nostoxanthinifaciens]
MAASRLYLALHLPMLAEDVARLAGEASTHLLVFVEKTGNAMRLTAISHVAARAGLAPGLTLADARARMPDLVARDRDHAGEARLLARIVRGCTRYTPMAAAEAPDGAILDITGCTHAFDGAPALLAECARRLADGGVTARLALGTTPEQARALARFGPPGEIGPLHPQLPQLRALPVEALEALPDVTVALRRAGLKTIGHLAERPRAMLAARFGDLALRLIRVLGEEDRRISPERLPAPIFALRRFAEPIGRVDDALACLEELLGETVTMLLERHQGGRRFAARLFRSDGHVAGLEVGTGRPTRDGPAVMRLFRERLDALADPIDPGFGFDCVRLDVVATEPLAARQEDHLAPAREAEALDALVDRLAARLGTRRIHRAAPADTHIPECASVAASPSAPVVWETPEPDEPPLRPLTLLDPPQPVDVLYALPEGPPRRFAWAGRQHDVARWEGPERIAAEWWRRRDRGGLTRDYYRVEDAAGHRFWLFRHGLHERELTTPAWYLHGLFA